MRAFRAAGDRAGDGVPRHHRCRGDKHRGGRRCGDRVEAGDRRSSSRSWTKPTRRGSPAPPSQMQRPARCVGTCCEGALRSLASRRARCCRGCAASGALRGVGARCSSHHIAVSAAPQALPQAGYDPTKVGQRKSSGIVWAWCTNLRQWDRAVRWAECHTSSSPLRSWITCRLVQPVRSRTAAPTCRPGSARSHPVPISKRGCAIRGTARSRERRWCWSCATAARCMRWARR